jgi:hypothetical protein
MSVALTFTSSPLPALRPTGLSRRFVAGKSFAQLAVSAAGAPEAPPLNKIAWMLKKGY